MKSRYAALSPEEKIAIDDFVLSKTVDVGQEGMSVIVEQMREAAVPFARSLLQATRTEQGFLSQHYRFLAFTASPDSAL